MFQSLAHMPLGPRSLLGFANLHGVVLPVVGLRRLLGLGEAPLDDEMRIVVINRGSPVGFVVDQVDKLVALPPDRLKGRRRCGRDSAGFLDGIIRGAEGESTIKVLIPQRLLRTSSVGLVFPATAAWWGCRFLQQQPRLQLFLTSGCGWSRSILASRNTRSRSIAFVRSSNCLIIFRKCHGRRPRYLES